MRSLGAGFAKLWAASGLSNIGDGVRLTALPLLAATLTRDPTAVAAVTFASYLPWLLFGPLVGVVADRFDRRVLMVRAQLFRMVLVVLLTLVVVAGQHSLVLLYAVGFLLGAGEVLHDISAQALIPLVVNPGDLERANGRLFGTEIGANQFVGPPLGGFAFGVSAALPFALDALTFGVGAGLLTRIGGSFAPTRAGEGRRRLREDLAEGVSFVWRGRVYRALVLAVAVANLALGRGGIGARALCSGRARARRSWLRAVSLGRSLGKHRRSRGRGVDRAEAGTGARPLPHLRGAGRAPYDDGFDKQSLPRRSAVCCGWIRRARIQRAPGLVAPGGRS